MLCIAPLASAPLVYLAETAACAPTDGVLPGVVRQFNEAFGGLVFPSSPLIFKTGCSNFAEDWNIVRPGSDAADIR